MKHSGDLVVCIDASGLAVGILKEGSTYAVREFFRGGTRDIDGLTWFEDGYTLYGVPNPMGKSGIRDAWRASRFRKYNPPAPALDSILRPKVVTE